MPEPGDDFYVGYLPTPRAHRNTLRVVLPAAIALLALVAILVAGRQRDAGPGVWRDEPTTHEGTIIASPYPMLATLASDGSIAELRLLIEEGKHGAARARGLDGRRVVARGRLLERSPQPGRVMMLELLPGDEGLAPREGAPAPLAAPAPDARLTLRGEIIDSKCYHGAMKPGEGKAHKACATLCIRGGIPAMLLVRHGVHAGELLLLAGPDGGPIPREAHEFIGEPVEVTGEVVRLGPLRVLRIGAAAVRRVGG